MFFKSQRFKAIALVAMFLLVVGGLAACGNQRSASNKKTLTVATSGTLYPTSYHDSKTKKLTGYDIEVVRAVAKDLGMKVKFKEYNVDGQLAAVKSGKADLAVNDYAISPARKKQFLMTTPFKHSFNSIVVRARDISGINSWADIKG